ncbi:hypothetical protein DPMN_001310 [Dreissena polymorpha]|uniref:Uncharacterized protein n=1 Tax=Dreissena polymorpha TaxID=45954 RepID=A0A9D4MI88_DREPO|nr:hypothetical protein DPMN_001310 [Dreissena polymorpha]
MKPFRTNAPPPGGHVFQATGTIFKLVRAIIGTDLLTKFHDDRTKKNMASRVLTMKMPRPLGGLVFPPTGTIFELIQDIIRTNCLAKFHDDRTINVASRVLIRKKAPPTGGHVFKATETVFELILDIIGTYLLTKFHKHRTINVASRVLTRFYYSFIRKNAPPPGGHFHEDRTINVASKVKKSPPFGSHVFQENVTVFELNQDIIKTNLLIKFHEDWTINVASRELTRQILTAHDARRTKSDHKSSP